jgi:hypothetical protein
MFHEENSHIIGIASPYKHEESGLKNLTVRTKFQTQKCNKESNIIRTFGK